MAAHCAGKPLVAPARPAAAAAALPRPGRQPRPQAAGQQWCPARRPVRCSASAAGFHQSLLVASERPAELPPLPGPLAVREADSDEELQAAAWLRALSFYRYPEERKFAAEVHRLMVAEEEYKTLKVARLSRQLDQNKPDCRERSACLVALCPAAGLADLATGEPLDERLVLGLGGSGSGSGSSGSTSGGSGGGHSTPARSAGAEAAPYSPGGHGTHNGSGGGDLGVVGTLDLYAVRALPGEVLIGNSENAAYLANVCTAAAARRRGVGEALLRAARDLALAWGVEDLYVHTMAVNEIAVAFYERHGFVVEKEESSNAAHYRGRCLDGIEGRGRTLLLRDTRLRG